MRKARIAAIDQLARAQRTISRVSQLLIKKMIYLG
jgi:hypothetical protein